MKTASVKSGVSKFQNYELHLNKKCNSQVGIIPKSGIYQNNVNKNSVSFGAGMPLSKSMLLKFKNLSEYMQEASEMTNALIAMIGTGVIAPFAIMCSPKKKCKHEHDKKVDRDKKIFQAIRQPISAFLAFAFQVPTTIGIAMGFNHLAYKKHLKLFDDETLGQLIPNKKYLKAQAKKAMKAPENSPLKTEWANELNLVSDENMITEGLIKRIRQDYNDVNVEVSEEELKKLAANPKRRLDYKLEKMAKEKHEHLIDEKVKTLDAKKLNIQDLDIVTEKYQKLAKDERFKGDFEQLRKDAKLNFFDKFLQAMGMSNKKLDKLAKAEKELAKQKGLILMKEDVARNEIPDFFKDSASKLRKFVKNKDKASQKIYANKIFWLSLVTNLFMVAISCTALNWLHPKFAELFDKVKEKRNAEKTSANKKVEVKKG